MLNEPELPTLQLLSYYRKAYLAVRDLGLGLGLGLANPNPNPNLNPDPNPDPDPNANQVRWDTPWPDYAPTHFEAAVLAKHVRGMKTGGGWADPAEIDTELENLISTVRVAFDSP